MSNWIDEPLDFIMLIRIKDDGYANRHPSSPRYLDRPRPDLRGPEMVTLLAGRDFRAHRLRHRALAGRLRLFPDLSHPGKRRLCAPLPDQDGQV